MIITRDDYIKKQEVEVYNIDLKKVKEKYDNKEELNKLERYLLVMVLDTVEELREISKGDEVLEKVVDKIIELSKDEEIQKAYIQDIQRKEIINLIKQGIDKSIISSVMSLSIEEINKIIDME